MVAGWGHRGRDLSEWRWRNKNSVTVVAVTEVALHSVYGDSAWRPCSFTGGPLWGNAASHCSGFHSAQSCHGRVRDKADKRHHGDEITVGAVSPGRLLSPSPRHSAVPANPQYDPLADSFPPGSTHLNFMIAASHRPLQRSIYVEVPLAPSPCLHFHAS